MKKLFINLLYYTGVLGLVLKLGYRNSVTIFMLHGVEDETSHDTWRPAWRRHSRQQLKGAIEGLSPYFDMVSIGEAVNLLEITRNAAFRKKLVFTFDDGYLNNMNAALPILQSNDVPGVFYLATGILERRDVYWIDRLDYLFQALGKREIPVTIGTVSAVIDGCSRTAYENSYRSLRLKLKAAYPKDEDMIVVIDAYASQAEKEAQKSLSAVLENDKWADLIAKEKLKDIPPLIELGSHTVNHRRADSLPETELVAELEQSREFIEENSGRKCLHFCYPNGNFSEKAARTIERLGYLSAVTTEEGTNYPGVDLFKLKRVPFPHFSSKPELLYFMIRNMR